MTLSNEPPDHSPGSETPTPSQTGPATLEQIHGLFEAAVAYDAALTLLKGFNVDFSGLLSVEVSMNKTMAEVEDAMPSLLENLRVKQRMFSSMSCEMHGRMRRGGL